MIHICYYFIIEGFWVKPCNYKKSLEPQQATCNQRVFAPSIGIFPKLGCIRCRQVYQHIFSVYNKSQFDYIKHSEKVILRINATVIQHNRGLRLVFDKCHRVPFYNNITDIQILLPYVIYCLRNCTEYRLLDQHKN